MKKILFIIVLISVMADYSLAIETDTVIVEADTVKVETLARTSESWNSQPLPNYLTGTPEITILRITIPPGTQLPLHKHPVINAGVLTAGELTVLTEDGDVLHLEAGDAIVEVVDKWHYGINESEKHSEIIVFYAGIADTPITIDYSR
jgi:quercetin dioxygenase-like cupin family protein